MTKLVKSCSKSIDHDVYLSFDQPQVSNLTFILRTNDDDRSTGNVGVPIPLMKIGAHKCRKAQRSVTSLAEFYFGRL